MRTPFPSGAVSSRLEAYASKSVYQLTVNRDCTGAANKVVNLVGCKSPHHHNCLGGWLADPMHAEATKHVQLGRKSLGCPAVISRSGRDDLGGEQTGASELDPNH
jgi:Ni,Fe-hydrogenase I large subunit